MMRHNEYLQSLREDLVIHANLRNHALTFNSTWGLFSPRDIDEGSRLLLDYIEVFEADDCLDLGCGYGPIGVTLAKLAPHGSTLLADKDFVAVEYSNKNIRLNHITNAEAVLSNGFDQLGARRFDLVTSNIPAKVGKELLQLILNDAYDSLKPGGRIYVVTINGLRKFMQRHFLEVFGNYDKLKQGKNYTVAMAYKSA